MFKRFGLSAAVLGTVLALASPVAGLARQRGYDEDSGYSRFEGHRADQQDGNRYQFENNGARRGTELSGRRYHTQPIFFQAPSSRSNTRTNSGRAFSQPSRNFLPR